MASVPQPQFFSPLKPTKIGASATQNLQLKSFTFTFKFKNLRVSSSSGPFSSEFSSENSSEKALESDLSEVDPAKLAFAKAKAYEKIQSKPTTKSVDNPVQKSDGVDKKKDGFKTGKPKAAIEDEGKEEEVPISVKLAFEKAKEYRNKKDYPNPKIVENPFQASDRLDKINDDPKAGDLKVENKDKNKEEEVPLTVKQAFENAKEYRKKKDGVVDSSQTVSGSEQTSGMLPGML